ncbi:MAG: hypothetical protein L6Q54_05570 [Leptospiraceae bacterium]|nr:hypothetical protein [Leptospiraceae bacterium]MCK6380707.1 hypothetical protein [Leptospiraceae bacterium]NUM41249.1 hypothetical protein [Leptospiraceae bacterium]
MIIKTIKLYGAIIGSAIVLPAAAMALAVFAIGSIFQRNAHSGFEMAQILSIMTVIGAFGVPALTVANFVKPDNELRIVSASIVTLVGLISTSSVVYTLMKDNSPLQYAVLVAAVLILVSGILQFRKE